VGKRYKVYGVRDADCGPPKGELPDEVRIRLPLVKEEWTKGLWNLTDEPGMAEFWFPMHYFRVVE
jgi:hypothetical protein